MPQDARPRLKSVAGAAAYVRARVTRYARNFTATGRHRTNGERRSANVTATELFALDQSFCDVFDVRPARARVEIRASDADAGRRPGTRAGE